MPDSKGEINSIAARRDRLAVGEPGRRGGMLTVPAVHLGKMIRIRKAETLYQTIVYRSTFFALSVVPQQRCATALMPAPFPSGAREEKSTYHKGKEK